MPQSTPTRCLRNPDRADPASVAIPLARNAWPWDGLPREVSASDRLCISALAFCPRAAFAAVASSQLGAVTATGPLHRDG